ncbi:MAG: hypothetical protein ACJAUP_003857 [Cellvibrionaceae bacterium]|jgi:hypothetical protein
MWMIAMQQSYLISAHGWFTCVDIEELKAAF